ncbi:assimilatory sulfite reductase (NADPH) hemoprotein subunit [Neisseria animalis]|uniref:Sulfite reductase [NADPH] hemoprotein beta-component n=1 Tax=Neisseria animalis TaxID=492 RepID=A0A5P3MSR0_NEIAN|nr:assimilatory sulfite reductase (NADPH) hemoprotein subunit [Neisseria animalis]QEY24647.1 assimilatory sulfite reductase (NADPH) hemoprotein subunit [Neisseria animalis]ROW32942.1 assimilatory sulfite reductase (NADPH) hemoprotein subunit [Neisseria animalis]VEE07550.1 sulfite reductase beta subunit [Neisseria animalis]
MTTNDPRAKLPDAPLADNERLKSDSRHLRGTIAEDLQDGLTGGFNGDNFQLIRFHGMYEQDNRDIRAERNEQKLDNLKNVMLRCRLPGGIIKPEQWLGIDQFAGEKTLYGSIRLTNRQTFQFHGVLKDDIKPMHQWLNELGLDSIATAGDVNRNVLCTSNPVESSLHKEAYEWAKKISEHLLPKTRAYAEIWLDGKKLHSTEDLAETPLADAVKSGDATEPVLGKNYLPRKFKTTVVIPPHNDVDLHANDLNFIAIEENGKLAGFNVLVGGGLSMEHGNHKTYPNTAREFGFIGLDKVLDCAAAVVSVQRDWGNRSDRKNAKTRYTIERVGLEVFIDEVENRMGAKFEPLRPYRFTSRGDRIGWVQGEEGNWHLTLFIENGRLLDYPGRPLKTGMREIAKVHKGDFRLTANQNLIVANVPEAQKAQIEQIAREHGLISDKVSRQRENSMACVALPTCPLAMAEAERFLPAFSDKIDEIMAENGLSDDYIVLRVNGCPNGCGRSMLAEIGLVGKAVGRYNLYTGGNRQGTRLPRLFKENITEPEILDILKEWISAWAKNRETGEGFGDFAVRTGIVQPVLDAPRDFWIAQA